MNENKNENSNKYRIDRDGCITVLIWVGIFIGCIYFWGWVIKLIGDLFIYLS